MASVPAPAAGPVGRGIAHPRLVAGFLLLAALWGSSFLFIKVGVAQLHPTYVTLTRVALGAAATSVVVVLLRDRLPRGLRTWGHLAVVGVVGIALPFTLFGFAEQRVPSLLAGIWNATTPLVTLPLAVLLYRTERFTVRKLVGFTVGFGGVLVVLGVWAGVGGSTLTGQLMCLGASCCYALTIPYTKRFLAHRPLSGLAVVAGQLSTAAAVMAVVAPVVAGAPPPPGSLSWQVVGSMVTLGVFGTGLAFVIHLRNIRLVGASAASLVTYLTPLVAVVAGIVLLDESLTWHQPVGALLVLIGVAVSQGVGRRPVRGRPVVPVHPTGVDHTPTAAS